ncbi:DUF924-domain-containing protein [Choiromyces venosus 120613-1]|uniref:DUF924-domain-containing protein n=1 Tax=Choiromyces venosus 120613-1 TaxID=1336337 RepID=A0A3N4JH67_9PEZI|nr:DUF924-domain-containing protein [Choiromyces venosus 120613-1]
MSTTTTPETTFTPTTATAVLNFWFTTTPLHPTLESFKRWFQPDPAFDSSCRETYLPLITTLSHLPPSELHSLATTPEEALSLILLLDQLPRNIHRADSSSVYNVTDPLALSLARIATAPERRFDLGPELAWKGVPSRRCWFYLPFGHSEDLADHEFLKGLHAEMRRDCEGGEGEGFAKAIEGFSDAHTEVIAKFGRYPYRNAVLGRENTKEEVEWLEGEKVAWAR